MKLNLDVVSPRKNRKDKSPRRKLTVLRSPRAARANSKDEADDELGSSSKRKLKSLRMTKGKRKGSTEKGPLSPKEDTLTIMQGDFMGRPKDASKGSWRRLHVRLTREHLFFGDSRHEEVVRFELLNCTITAPTEEEGYLKFFNKGKWLFIKHSDSIIMLNLLNAVTKARENLYAEKTLAQARKSDSSPALTHHGISPPGSPTSATGGAVLHKLNKAKASMAQLEYYRCQIEGDIVKDTISEIQAEQKALLQRFLALEQERITMMVQLQEQWVEQQQLHASVTTQADQLAVTFDKLCAKLANISRRVLDPASEELAQFNDPTQAVTNVELVEKFRQLLALLEPVFALEAPLKLQRHEISQLMEEAKDRNKILVSHQRACESETSLLKQHLSSMVERETQLKEIAGALDEFIAQPKSVSLSWLRGGHGDHSVLLREVALHEDNWQFGPSKGWTAPQLRVSPASAKQKQQKLSSPAMNHADRQKSMIITAEESSSSSSDSVESDSEEAFSSMDYGNAIPLSDSVEKVGGEQKKKTPGNMAPKSSKSRVSGFIGDDSHMDSLIESFGEPPAPPTAGGVGADEKADIQRDHHAAAIGGALASMPVANWDKATPGAAMPFREKTLRMVAAPVRADSAIFTRETQPEDLEHINEIVERLERVVAELVPSEKGGAAGSGSSRLSLAGSWTASGGGWKSRFEGVTYVGGLMATASRDRLIDIMVRHHDVEPNFDRTILLTFRTFMTPVSFLRSLLVLFTSTPVIDRERVYLRIDAILLPMRKQVLDILQRWSEFYPSDFKNQGMRPLLMRFVQICEHMELPVDTPNRLLAICDGDDNVGRPRVSTITEGYSKPAPMIRMDSFTSAAPSLMDVPPQELARQLTMMDWRIVDAILPEELWSHNGSGDASSNSNVNRYVRRFNAMSRWLITQVIQHDQVDVRAAALTNVIKLQKHLKEMRNYSTLMVCVASLANTAITRLKKTIALLPKDAANSFHGISKFVERNSIWIRQEMEKNMEAKVCYIPHVALLMKDLVAIEESPSFINDAVNVQKLRNKAKIIWTVVASSRIPYGFTEVTSLQHWFTADQLSSSSLDDDEAYKRSLQLEPRATSPSN